MRRLARRKGEGDWMGSDRVCVCVCVCEGGGDLGSALLFKDHFYLY